MTDPKKTLAFWTQFAQARFVGTFPKVAGTPTRAQFLESASVQSKRANAIRSLDASGIDPVLVVFAIKCTRDCDECSKWNVTASDNYPPPRLAPSAYEPFNSAQRGLYSALQVNGPENDKLFQELRLALSAKYGTNFPDYDRSPPSVSPAPKRKVDATTESRATAALNTAKALLEKNKEAAKERLRRIIVDFPKTNQAAEAQSILDTLK